MKRLFVLISVAVFILFMSYLLWSAVGREVTHRPKANLRWTEGVGTNQNRGNMIGIQPWMEPADYASQALFHHKLNLYFQEAQRKGWLIPNKAIVVLPEYLGTWLVAADEKASVYTAATVEQALTKLVGSNLIAFLKSRLAAPNSVQDKTKYAVFAMKGPSMAKAYQQTFAKLAAHYRVTIVAGSILLPTPTVENGILKTGAGPLYNVSAVFRPSGELEPQLIRKVYPVTDELPFVCPASPAGVPVFNTTIGKLGVLVCADSWNSPVYRTLKQKGATLVAVPSYLAGNKVWNTGWKGYSGTETPADAEAAIGKLTEGQAWLTYAMGGRARPEAGITKGLNVFLRGKLWDLGADGSTIILNDSARAQPAIEGSVITCLWL